MMGRRFSLVVDVVLVGVLLFYGVFRMVSRNQKESVLRIGYPVTWGALVPSLQHTAYADALLGNQFETLVQLGREGLPRPLGAKSWSVSQDSRVYRFQIDTSKRYSDGSYLKAQDFKDSWERGLRAIPKSANNSLKDVLYNVVGFEVFESSGVLKGVVVHGNDELEIEFKKPFRMALDHLSGSRFAAFKENGNELFGTGRFRILKNDEKEVHFYRNPYHVDSQGFQKIVVSVVDVNEGAQAVKDGKIDVYAYFARMANTPCKPDDDIDCFTGAETGHVTVNLNGMPGRTLSEKRLRLAVQYLVQQILLTEKIRPYSDNRSIAIDLQTFLPLQAGRLPNDEALAIINSGKEFVPELIAVSKEKPLYVVSMRDDTDMLAAFRKAGIVCTDNSGNVDFKTGLQMHYKTFDPDILIGAFSVANGDPDGIYHLLGKQGAISTPMILRKSVDHELEVGRAITDRSAMKHHYEKVAREILNEVPFVHVGFTMGLVAYNKHTVALPSPMKTREDVGFQIYLPR